MFPTGVCYLCLGLDIVTGLSCTHVPNFGSLSWFLRNKEHPSPLSPHLKLLRMLEVTDWGLASWSWFWYSRWFLMPPWSEFWLSIFIWRYKENQCPWSPNLGLWRMQNVLDWGLVPLSWFGYGHWSFIHPCSKFWLSSFLTGVLNPDIDLDRVTGLWYTHIPNFGSLSWFWSYKEHPCPSSHDLELWRMLEVPDWGFASWYWFKHVHWSLAHSYSKFWLSILIFKVQRTSMSSKSWIGALEDAAGSWLGFDFFILIRIWSLVLIHPYLNFISLSWTGKCKEHPSPLSPYLGLQLGLAVPDWV